MNYRLLLLLGLLASALEANALPPVIDNSSYPGKAAPANTVIPGTQTDNAMMELMAKMDQLQAEVQQLTGKVEEQAHEISELKKQQKAFAADFDERLVTLENKSLGSDPIESATTPEPDAATSEEEGVANVPVPEANNETPEPTATDKQPNQAPASTQAEKDVYKQNLDLLRHGHTDESIEGFIAFLSQYPNSGLANNAQYWLGEAYRAKHDDVSAMKAFNDVVAKYPNGIKVPDALLKLGYMAVEQNQLDQAREYLNRVVNDYPNTQPALLAERKLSSLKAANP